MLALNDLAVTVKAADGPAYQRKETERRTLRPGIG